MRAGFAKNVITPTYSMPMAGFDRRVGTSCGTLDELYVRVLALEDGEKKPFLFCVFDVLGVDSTLCRQARAELEKTTGVLQERIWVSSTHTHSGPSGIFAGGKTYDENYVARLLQICGQTGRQAVEDLAPATMTVATGTVTGVASRRNQGRSGAEFPMPLLLTRLARDGNDLRLVKFICHPTVLDEKNTRYSRDLPGAAMDAMPGGEYTAMVNGACADLSTRFTRTASDPAELKRLGDLLAAGIAALGQWQEVALEQIRTSRQVIRLCRTASLSGALRDSILAELHRRMAACQDAQARREYDSRIAVLERSAVGAETDRRIEISAVDLKAYILVSLPFEVDSPDGENLEKELTAAAGKPVYLMCYTGGYDGYLPSGKPLSADSSYEDIASRYLPESREMVWECAKQCVLNVRN